MLALGLRVKSRHGIKFSLHDPSSDLEAPSNLSLGPWRTLREGLSKVQVEDGRRSKTGSLGILL